MCHQISVHLVGSINEFWIGDGGDVGGVARNAHIEIVKLFLSFIKLFADGGNFGRVGRGESVFIICRVIFLVGFVAIVGVGVVVGDG